MCDIKTERGTEVVSHGQGREVEESHENVKIKPSDLYANKKNPYQIEERRRESKRRKTQQRKRKKTQMNQLISILCREFCFNNFTSSNKDNSSSL